MKRHKRFVSLIICTVLFFTMTACGTQNTQTAQESGGVSEESSAVDSGQETAVGSQSEMVGTDGSVDIDEIIEHMSARDKVEQMMFVSYRVWEETGESDTQDTGEDINQTVENTENENPKVNVTELNDELRTDLKEHHYGGVALFAENFVDAEQTLRLVSEIQTANMEGGGLPLLIAADQEGGSVARITFGTTGVGNMALAATGDPENAKTMAAVYGKEMSKLGVNTDFAPVMDINNNPDNPVIGVRSFSDDPSVVSEYGLAYMEGLHDTGAIATLKHFPGHGDTDTDSHTGFPCIQKNLEELEGFELIPFKQAIDAGADMVMTAHIQYPQIEKQTYTSITSGEEVFLPATMSRTILTDILREDMGFEGVIVSDAIDMAAISDNFEPEDILKLTINAGVNMLILPMVTNAEQYQRFQDMVDMGAFLAESGELDMERIDDSVRRILALKEKYGLISKSDFTVTDEKCKEASTEVGSAQNRQAAWEIAEKALTLYKNDGAFPLDVNAGESTLILFADSCASRVASGDLAVDMLKSQGKLPQDQEVTVLVNTKDNEEDCVKAAGEADHVILVHRMYNSANLDPDTEDGFSSGVFDRIIEERHKTGKRVILVSCQLPYDAARFETADAVLLTYNSSVMRELPPESGAGSAYSPNLVVGLMACFGDGDVNGRAPVEITRD